MSVREDRSLLRLMGEELVVYIAWAVGITIVLLIIVALFTHKEYVELYSDRPWKQAIIDSTGARDEEEIEFNNPIVYGSKFYILDEHGNVIFNSTGYDTYPFSVHETEMIPERKRFYSDNVKEIYDEEYGTITSVSDKRCDKGLNSILLIDADRNVVYASCKTYKGKLTKNEFDCITGRKENYELLRRDYTGKDLKKYSIVFFNSYSKGIFHLEEIEQILNRIHEVVKSAFFILYIIYIYRVRNKLKKPLSLLERKIESFPRNVSCYCKKTDVPREFEKVFDKFDDMEKRVAKIQNENKDILSDIFHDLKAPISIIQLYSKMINDGLTTEEENKRYLSIIEKRAIDLGQLISMLSEYARIQRSEYRLNTEYIDIIEYSRRYLIDKYDEVIGFGFELEVDFPEEEVKYKIDKIQMKRVYDNLIGNSIKYNKEGTRIFFTIKIDNNEVILRIGDNGIGIDKSVRGGVFRAFTTVGENNAGGGAGLGLAIADKIVQLHKGDIRLLDEYESELAVLFEIRFKL